MTVKATLVCFESITKYHNIVLIKVYDPKLTLCHVPKLTQNVPKLTGYPNVPKNYQCHCVDDVAGGL